ncbi:hypothetical protein B0H17DRAFT_1150024 [Mycena rosella]|uniref:Uncharacterized protein n=1 Tax=Mycena rosella TaxID=1033263 RepID=A0AAD7FQ95_MYCRO|nr:hypothetical protein B0H17DRAFT_1150024 [Mycena rosella]
MREQPLRPALKTIPLHPGTYFRRSPAKSFELTDLQGHRDSRDKYQVLFEAAACTALEFARNDVRTVGTLLGRLSSRFDAPALRAPALSRSCRGFGFDPPRGGPLGPSSDDYVVISMLQRFKRRRRHDLAGGLDLILLTEDCWNPAQATIESYRRCTASSVGAVTRPLGASEDDDPVFSTLLCVTRRCCHDLEEGLDISPPYQRSSGPSAHDHQLVSTLQRVKCWCRRNIAPRYLQDHSDALHWTMESLRRCKTLSLGVVAIIQWPYFVAIEALTIVQFFKRTSQEIKALGPLDCARKPVISW